MYRSNLLLTKTLRSIKSGFGIAIIVLHLPVSHGLAHRRSLGKLLAPIGYPYRPICLTLTFANKSQDLQTLLNSDWVPRTKPVRIDIQNKYDAFSGLSSVGAK